MEKVKESSHQHLLSANYVKWFLLFGITIIFTITLYPNLVVTKHAYTLGDVVERNIKAPKDFLIEDKEATESNRRRAVESVLTVYDYDTALASNLSQGLKQAFADIRAVFEAESKKQNKIKPMDTAEDPSIKATALPSPPGKEKISVHDQIWQMKKDFEDKIGITVNNGAYTILENELFSEDISNLIVEILSTIMKNGVVTNKEILLKEAENGIALRTVGTKTEFVTVNLKQFYGLDQAKTMVRIIGDDPLKGLNYNLLNLIVDFTQRVIQPNITLNRSETEERKKRAASEIKPILYKIKEGEMVLREGERVTEVQLLKLNALEIQTKNKQILPRSIGSAMIILCLLMTTYIIYIKHPGKIERDSNKNLIFLTSVIITFSLLAVVSASMSQTLAQNTSFSISPSSISFGIPIASGAMIICLFMGLEVALPLAMVIAVFTAVIFQNGFEI